MTLERQVVDPRRAGGDALVETWPEVRAWRRAKRAELLAQRMAVPGREKRSVGSTLRDLIREQFPELHRACVGFYWPIKGEIDPYDLIQDLIALGAEAALPVVVERRKPLEFWAWRPGMKWGRGLWDIPIPAERAPVQPTALLVPLLGFDEAGYRLGYGGGYYDRTLATLNPKPLTIGIGYEFGRLQTIYPQPHDIPLDTIVTEAGAARFRRRGEPVGSDDGPAYASPPCFLREVDPAYLGYLSAAETIALLNQLLEGERAGARGIAEIVRHGAGASNPAVLPQIARDEGRFCAMLIRHITRLGGTPSTRTGSFYEKLIALGKSGERIDLLNRGQAWVVRKLRDALPKISDDALRRDLEDMLDVHQRNVQRCTDTFPPAA